MIEARGLHRWFGSNHAVRGVSFGVRANEVVGLLGPNGAGKTTTIRMLAGVLGPHRGGVVINGIDAGRHPARSRRSLGYLPESAAVYTEMRARPMLAHRAALLGLSGRDRRRAVDRALDRCGLTDMPARKRVGAMSKGYRQRVALACAIVHDPRVLILDEPTNGLDPTQLRDARSLIGGLAQDRTVIVCSHVLPEIERLCDRAIIIGGGRVLADGPIDQLHHSAHGAVCIAEIRLDGRPLPTAAEFPGAATVDASDAEDGWTRLRITAATTDGTGLRQAVGRALAGAPIRELRDERIGLEAAFLGVLEADGDPDA